MRSFKRFTTRVLAAGAVLSAAAAAHADDGIPPVPVTMDPASAVNPVSLVQGSGIRIGQGTVFRPQLGVVTGVVNNVFYENQDVVTAGLLRILVEVGTSSLPVQRLMIRTENENTDDPSAPQTLTSTDSGDFQYSADLYATYDQYLSTNDNVTAQGGLGGGLLLRGVVNPRRPLQFGFQEHFNRIIRSTNYESREDTNRDINKLDLRLSYVPDGRALGGYLYYENTIDVFETDAQRFANRLQHTAGLHINWQWLPLTRVYGDASIGYFTGLGDSTKINSYPLRLIAGIQTAFTLNTTFNGYAGYTNGFYASGPSYSTITAGGQLGYRYSPLGRVTAMYAYEHQDSINANFYRDHMFGLTFEQYFVPFVVLIRPELRFREYEGTIVMGPEGNTRKDTIIGATAGMRYNFRDWIAATIDYQLQVVNSDFIYDAGGVMIDPSYVRHELLVGVRAAY